MTFSIVARSPDDGSLGVAVASKFLAVGSAVPAAAYGVGAIATQSFANTLYRRDGLALLRENRTAQETLDALLAADEQRDERQVGVVDAAGRTASWTGPGCMSWAGDLSGPGVAIQGNILTGPDVVKSMLRAWLDRSELAFPERLMAALTAGDAAGGDSRGRQSAALYVVSAQGGYTPGDDLAYDLRVDDHEAPIPELARLLELHHVYFDEPSDEDMLPLEGALAAEVAELVRSVGRSSLEAWAGVENYELRLRDGAIDGFVLERLREAARNE